MSLDRTIKLENISVPLSFDSYAQHDMGQTYVMAAADKCACPPLDIERAGSEEKQFRRKLSPAPGPERPLSWRLLLARTSSGKSMYLAQYLKALKWKVS